jgi:hypothetical protein
VEHLQTIDAALAPPLGFGFGDAPAPANQTILITGSDLVPHVTPDPLADPNTICPTCGHTGDLGVVDLPGRTSDYSCATCGTMWRVNLERATSR